MMGTSVVGTPQIVIGRTKHVDFGSTSAFADVSDMWNETISEDGKHYLVDGQWRELEIEEHEITVRFGGTKKL